MSRDRGTADQAVDQGYGVVTDLKGEPVADLIIRDANQEHGIVGSREGAATPLSLLELGDLVRVLPNHACATAAQFDHYVVVDADGALCDRWTRVNGW